MTRFRFSCGSAFTSPPCQVSGFGTMLCTPLLGAVSDEYGRKPLIILTFAVSALPFGKGIRHKYLQNAWQNEAELNCLRNLVQKV